LSEEIMHDNDEIYDEDVKFVLTEWGCLSSVLTDYGVDISRVTGKIGEHIVEDFMELMVKCGYIGRAENSDVQGE
jgi:hypothetical protein